MGINLEPGLESVQKSDVSAVAWPDFIFRWYVFMNCLVVVNSVSFYLVGDREICVFRQYESRLNSIYGDCSFSTDDIDCKRFVFSLYNSEGTVVGRL